MTVLVTGASGWIGSCVMQELARAGIEAVGLVRRGSSLDRLESAAPKSRLIYGDLADSDSYRKELLSLKPDTCIHLAWYAEPGSYLQSDLNLTCLNGSLALLALLAEAGCRRMVAAGTCGEYKVCDRPLRESDPLEPTTLYAATKAALCEVGIAWAKKHALSFAWGRVFLPYGPGEDRRRAVSALIRALLLGKRFPATDGTQVRDYLHVQDVARAFVAVAQSDQSGAFNIASGKGQTMKSLFQKVATLCDKPDLIDFGAIPCRQWDPAYLVGDNNQLVKLGWKPSRPLDEGLRETINWWKSRL